MSIPTAHEIPGYNGLSLNVWDYGGTGIPLLLCHCNGGVGRLWDPVVAALPEGFRVFALDTRGYGDSDAPETPDGCTPESSGRDILAVIAALRLDSPIYAMGHSIGGAHLAWAEHLAPCTFTRMVWIDPIIAPVEVLMVGLELAAGARRRRNTFPSRQEARDRLGSKAPKVSWCPEALDAYIDHALSKQPDGSLALKCPGDREAWFYEQGAEGNIYHYLNTIETEILLLSAEGSELLPIVRDQAQLLPNAQTLIHPTASHFLPQEVPVWVAESAGEWLLEVSQGV